MMIIKTLSDMIWDEVCGAREYAKTAVEIKDEYPELANLMYDLSSVELGHMSKLHEHAKRLIADIEMGNQDVPDYMRKMWSDRHVKAIEVASEVKSYQSLFR